MTSLGSFAERAWGREAMARLGARGLGAGWCFVVDGAEARGGKQDNLWAWLHYETARHADIEPTPLHAARGPGGKHAAWPAADSWWARAAQHAAGTGAARFYALAPAASVINVPLLLPSLLLLERRSQRLVYAAEEAEAAPHSRSPPPLDSPPLRVISARLLRRLGTTTAGRSMPPTAWAEAQQSAAGLPAPQPTERAGRWLKRRTAAAAVTLQPSSEPPSANESRRVGASVVAAVVALAQEPHVCVAALDGGTNSSMGFEWGAEGLVLRHPAPLLVRGVRHALEAELVLHALLRASSYHVQHADAAGRRHQIETLRSQAERLSCAQTV